MELSCLQIAGNKARLQALFQHNRGDNAMKKIATDHYQVALGIFFGILIGNRFWAWLLSDAGVLSLTAASIVGGIAGWIATDPVRVFRGIQHVWTLVRARNKVAAYNGFCFGLTAASIVAALALLIVGIGTIIAAVDMEVERLHDTIDRSGMIVAVVFLVIFLVGFLTAYGEEISTSEPKKHFNMHRILTRGNIVAWMFWTVYGVCASLVLAFAYAHKVRYSMVFVMANIFVALCDIAVGTPLFIRRVFRYSFSRKALLSLIFSAIFTPISIVVPGGALLWAIIGAAIGQVTYSLLSVRKYHFTEPVPF